MSTLLATVMTLILVAVLGPASGEAMGGMEWQWVNPLPQGNSLSGIAWGGGTYVAVGDGGTILVSTDAVKWERVVSGTDRALTDIVYGDGFFVAVGLAGTILRSADGRTWTAHGEGNVTQGLYGVAHRSGEFLAVGDLGRLYRAKDGTSWTEVRLPTSTTLLAVAASGTQTVTTGNIGQVLASGDGAEWSNQPVQTLLDIIHVDGRFLAVGMAGTIATSADAKGWESIALGKANLHGVVAGGGRFVTVGDAGNTLYSTDGQFWEPSATATRADLRAVTYGSGRFVAVGTGGVIHHSVDGVSWTATSSGPLWALTGVARGTAGYVAVSDQGIILYSADGVRWEQVWQGEEEPVHIDLQAVTYGNGRYVAVGRQILTSTDGRTWTRASYPGVIATLRTVTYAAGIYVALGDQGKIVTSSDGVTWADQKRFTTINQLQSVAYGQGRFVASGMGWEVYTSLDGIAWKTLKLDDSGFAGIAFGNGLFVGGGDQVAYSADGSTWIWVGSGPRSVAAVAFQDGQFVAVGRAGRIWTSADGVRWTEDSRTPAANDLTDVTWLADGSILAVGARGTMLEGVPIRCGSLFSDLPGQHAACEAVELLAGRKVVGGYPDGTFQPDRTVTRAEFAKMVVTALGRQPDPAGGLPFNDVAGHWAASGGYLQQAVALGAMGGFPDGSFRPNEPVTRAQIIKVAVALSGRSATGTASYSDVASVAWYAGWVAQAEDAGLVGAGATYPVFTGAALGPDQPATRAEAALLLANLLQVVGK